MCQADDGGGEEQLDTEHDNAVQKTTLNISKNLMADLLRAIEEGFIQNRR